MQPAPQNPYPNYGQNLWFSLASLFMTYLLANQKFDTLIMTWYPISYANGGKVAKIDILFMTKMAEKPYTLRLHIPV